MVKMNNSTNSGKHADPPYLIGNTIEVLFVVLTIHVFGSGVRL